LPVAFGLCSPALASADYPDGNRVGISLNQVYITKPIAFGMAGTHQLAKNLRKLFLAVGILHLINSNTYKN